MATSFKDVPKFGLKFQFDHIFPEKRSQNYVPALKQIWKLLPLLIRYLIFYVKAKITGKSIIMDYIDVVNAQQIYGVPIGGIGSGTIGRGFRGEFCRFQLKPGIYEYNTVDADQFIVTIKDGADNLLFQSLLSSFQRSKLKAWKSLIDPKKCSFTGLYPRAWYVYDLSEYGVKLTCRQISPVIPHDYKSSSTPCGVFVWEIENVSNEERYVTLTFTLKNGTGDPKQDKNSICSSESLSTPSFESVLIHHQVGEVQCTYAISTKSASSPTTSVTKYLHFDPNSDGAELWLQLQNGGDLGKKITKNDTKYGPIRGELGSAIASKARLKPHCTTECEFSLIWHMPEVVFNGTKHLRYYTKIYGDEALEEMIGVSLKSYTEWEERIFKWHNEVLLDSTLPDWYKSALFNESYFVSDGGTIWTVLSDSESKKLPQNDPRQSLGHFAYLEGHEYRMYNTYDVHFYGSFCLAMNWPLLQCVLQYDMKDAIFVGIPEKWKMLYDGKMVERKVPISVPHDIGDPGEQPFVLINSYNIHDVSEWRDLNTKFVLQVFRDYILMNKMKLSIEPYGSDANFAVKYLQDMYEACFSVMKKSEQFDTDQDGLIENSGAPDQTYDTWIMTGASAYCGGLWLAALFAMTQFAKVLEKHTDYEYYQELLQRAKSAYEKKLWNGSYYNFDCSPDEKHSIMADQLCGHWYLRCCGFNYQVFPKEKVMQTLSTIYENNVRKFGNGTLGAVNGFIGGTADSFTIQSLETWTGVTYSLASLMIHEVDGSMMKFSTNSASYFQQMRDEAFKTAGGMYTSLSEKFGIAFSTPEAIYEAKFYRSVGYMRALAIWSMQLAISAAKN